MHAFRPGMVTYQDERASALELVNLFKTFDYIKLDQLEVCVNNAQQASFEKITLTDDFADANPIQDDDFGEMDVCGMDMINHILIEDKFDECGYLGE